MYIHASQMKYIVIIIIKYVCVEASHFLTSLHYKKWNYVTTEELNSRV